MVLIQEDEAHDEHVIYYLSQSLTSTEIKYQHVEKLALAAVQAVQHFRHYILSRKTTMISHCNPMQHILTRQLLGGQVLQVDFHSPGVRFRIRSRHIEEIPSFR
jgi:hypothetical protein